MEPIRDKAGNMIAFLDRSGDRVYLRDLGGTQLGYYDKITDRTYDGSGVQLSFGDTLGSLIPRP
ncbi:MAG: hypothetical protein GF403_05930 [Candidatus Coatesbacteria bacterium]|nr:hypothetical protein [Candidatus Coatesbacteria bacterium]